MPRGVQKAAMGAFGNAQKMGETANLRGANIYNDLFPQLTSEATNPQGFGIAGLNAMNTANQQSIGGSNAAAAGEGNLLAARTRNAGVAQPMISEANRAGARQLSQNAVGIQAANERERQSQQQNALRALQGLYGTQMNTALGAQGIGNEYLRTGLGAAQATQAAWNQNLGDVEKALGSLAPTGSGFASTFG